MSEVGSRRCENSGGSHPDRLGGQRLDPILAAEEGGTGSDARSLDGQLEYLGIGFLQAHLVRKQNEFAGETIEVEVGGQQRSQLVA